MQVKEIKRGDAFSAGNKTSNTLSKQKSDAVITVLILSIGDVCLTSPGTILCMVRNSFGNFLPKDVNNLLGGTMRYLYFFFLFSLIIWSYIGVYYTRTKISVQRGGGHSTKNSSTKFLKTLYDAYVRACNFNKIKKHF